jgi:hypothetical protein
MRLLRRSHSRFEDALDLLSGSERISRDVLESSVELPFTSQDVAAALLGGDLWYEPLTNYRSYLESIDRRPHLWTFIFGPSGDWDSEKWRSLSMEARLARSRVAPLSQEREVLFVPPMTGLSRHALRDAVEELCAADLCASVGSNIFRISPIASAELLGVDLNLVEIIAHWLCMLAHADHIERDRSPTGYEVCGYAEACLRCMAQWGVRPRSAAWIPPFHPGCRCFAQPRFAGVTRIITEESHDIR